MLAVFVSLVSLFSVVAGLKYDLAIPLPDKEIEAVALTILSLIFIFLVVIISTLFLYWWGNALSEGMETPSLGGYLWLFPIAIAFTGIYNLLTYWAVRLKEFPVVARTKIRQQIVTTVTQISLFKIGDLGLLLGNTAGTGIGVFTLAKRVLVRPSWKEQPVKHIGHVLKRYRSFPIFSTWGALLNTAGAQIPPLLFASMFGAGFAGLYALAHRLIAMPMGMVGQAVGQVFLSDAPAKYRSGELSAALNETHKILINCVLPPTAILILFGPLLFGFVFGDEWKASGEVASWLSLWMLMAFTTSPLSSVFMVTEKQHLGMIMQAVLLIVRISGIGVGVFYQDFMLAVIFFSLFNALGYLSYQIVSFQVLGLPWYIPARNYTPALILVCVLMLLNRFFSIGQSPVMFVAALALSGTYYLYILKRLQRD